MVPGSAPDRSKIPPACGHNFFQISPRGRVLVHPRAGALPETMALPRLWRGGDSRGLLRVDFAPASKLRAAISIYAKKPG